MHYANLCRRAPDKGFRIVRATAAAVEIALSSTIAVAQDANPAKVLEACRAIQDSAARLRCFESAASKFTNPPGAPASSSMEAWRLVRTPNPAKPGESHDAISIMRTPDLLRSDPDLAGLMIRCREQANEVLIAVITPFPLRARPEVQLGDMSTGTRVRAKVVPPGASIMLPTEATALAWGPWQSIMELPVQITDDQRTIRGVIPLKGLSAALQTLRANCPGR